MVHLLRWIRMQRDGVLCGQVGSKEGELFTLLFFLFFKKWVNLFRPCVNMLFHLSFKMGTLAHTAALCSLPARLANLYSLKCHVSIFRSPFRQEL